MGETSIDEETFEEYLMEMREHYTADKVINVPCLVDLCRDSESVPVSSVRYATRISFRGLSLNQGRRIQLQLFYQRLCRLPDRWIHSLSYNRHQLLLLIRLQGAHTAL